MDECWCLTHLPEACVLFFLRSVVGGCVLTWGCRIVNMCEFKLAIMSTGWKADGGVIRNNTLVSGFIFLFHLPVTCIL